MMGYEDFLNALGQRESGKAGYSAVNSSGYLGKYQMGEALLTDLGFYTSDGTSANDWKAGHWTGKDGVDSKTEFLDNHLAQEDAVHQEMALNWGRLKSVWQYVGQTIEGVKITVSGLLAGAHLVGEGGETKYLKSAGDTVPADGNHVPVTSYIQEFGGYKTPFFVERDANDFLTGGRGHEGPGGRNRRA